MRPLYVTTVAAAAALGVSRKTVGTWLQRGLLSGIRHTRVIASYNRQRGLGMPHWRVSVDSIERLLASAAGGEAAPIAVRRRLRQLAKPGGV